ncbi:MAG: hypothetical protein J7M25_10360, partial [Deltaproteobacteria bacterium]|nr:hypothetical protein [Deltaproteobacteria bacterium]
SSTLSRAATGRHDPEARAECVSSARWDLWRGRWVPTNSSSDSYFNARHSLSMPLWALVDCACLVNLDRGVAQFYGRLASKMRGRA